MKKVLSSGDANLLPTLIGMAQIGDKNFQKIKQIVNFNKSDIEINFDFYKKIFSFCQLGSRIDLLQHIFCESDQEMVPLQEIIKFFSQVKVANLSKAPKQSESNFVCKRLELECGIEELKNANQNVNKELAYCSFSQAFKMEIDRRLMLELINLEDHKIFLKVAKVGYNVRQLIPEYGKSAYDLYKERIVKDMARENQGVKNIKEMLNKHYEIDKNLTNFDCANVIESLCHARKEGGMSTPVGDLQYDMCEI